MDSLLLKQIVTELHSLRDSITHHSDKIQETVESIKSENWFLKLLPFIGIIVGAILAFVSQHLLRNAEIKKSNREFLYEAKNKILTALTFLRFQLKELAYLEVDSKYQFYQSLTDTSTDDKKKALDEHYNDYKYIADMKTKIGEGAAAINTAFTFYYKCRGTTFPPEQQTQVAGFIEHLLTLPRQEEYPAFTTSKDAHGNIIRSVIPIADGKPQADAELLREEYTKLIDGLKTTAELLN